jgi:hypothetical protein
MDPPIRLERLSRFPYLPFSLSHSPSPVHPHSVVHGLRQFASQLILVKAIVINAAWLYRLASPVVMKLPAQDIF